MRVGILGSGLMGGKLGTIFARAGHGRVADGEDRCPNHLDLLKSPDFPPVFVIRYTS